MISLDEMAIPLILSYVLLYIITNSRTTVEHFISPQKKEALKK